jgi:hypothetical protein
MKPESSWKQPDDRAGLDTWFTPWGSSPKASTLSADTARKELNPAVISEVQQIYMGWCSVGDMRQEQANRRTLNKAMAGMAIILGLIGYVNSHPCNYPKKRQYNSNCGP